VKYNGEIYPGLTIDVDGPDVQVKCMHSVGANRFFWPSREDVCWYVREDVLEVIPEPLNVTSRHKQVLPEIWKRFVSTS
jgi:hypothetical protein